MVRKKLGVENVRWHRSVPILADCDTTMNTPENPLTKEQVAHFTQRIAERKSLLLDEIRQVLARSNNEHYVDLIGGVGDTGDAAAPPCSATSPRLRSSAT